MAKAAALEHLLWVIHRATVYSAIVCVFCCCFNLLEDHVVKWWVWGCKTGASRSELNCFPKETEIYVRGRERSRRREGWAGRK